MTGKRDGTVFIHCDLWTVSRRIEFSIHPSAEWMLAHGQERTAEVAIQLCADLIRGAHERLANDGVPATGEEFERCELVAWAAQTAKDRERETGMPFDVFTGVFER